MNLKSKVFGVLSALALTATLGLGVASADTSVATQAEVWLGADAAVCTGGVDNTHLDLGSYKWNPTSQAYEPVGTAGSGTINATLSTSGAPGDQYCTLTLTGSDMTDGAGHTAFSLSDISIAGIPLSSPMSSGPINLASYGSTSYAYPLPVALNGAPDNVPTGHYYTVLTVTLSSAHP
jgi:hypothetical protein